MNITLDDITTDQKIDSKLCRLLPEPYDKYARNFKKWTDYAKRESPPGKCVFTCAVIKSMLAQRSEYIKTAVEIVENRPNQSRAGMLGLAGMVLCSIIGEEKSGIEVLREAVALDNCEFMRLTLAVELGNMRLFDESNKICEDVLNANPKSVKAKGILAQNHLDQGLLSKARRLVDEILTVKPNNTAVWHTSGDIYFADQNYESASLEYKKSLEFFKYKPYIYYRLSLCYYELNKIRKSKRYAKKITKETFEIKPYFIKNQEVVTQELNEILSK